MGVPARHREPARSGEAGGPPGNRPAGLVSVPERYVAGWACPACPELVSGSGVEGTPEDARKGVHIRGRSHAKAWWNIRVSHTSLIFDNFFLLTIQAILCQDTVIKYGSPGLFTRLSNKVGDFKKPLFQVLVIPRLLRFDYPERWMMKS